MVASAAPRVIRMHADTWASLHVVRALLLAKLGRNVTLDGVLRFLVEIFREARQKDPQIVNTAFERVFPNVIPEEVV